MDNVVSCVQIENVLIVFVACLVVWLGDWLIDSCLLACFLLGWLNASLVDKLVG